MTLRHLVPTLAVAGCALLSACGGSDKPAYCSDVDNFKDAVSGLTSVDVSQNGVSAISAAVDKVTTSGQTLVDSAKSEFGAQANALKASITALAATAQQLGDPSTQKAALAAIPAEAVAVNSAYQSLATAVKDKCD
jgi:hypothetical protein